MMESKMKHTPEPWRLEKAEPERKGNYYVLAPDMNLAIARVYGNAGEANARRIVACVNACAGIDTEWLENNGAYAVPVPSLRTLLNQRDELLAAIEDYLPYMPKSTAKNGGADGHSEMLKASDMLKDAFAKCEVKS